MTRFSDVIEKLNGILLTGTYQDPGDFGMRQIKRECEKVRDVDPAHGWSLLSCYFSLVGDFEEVERCYRAARLLGRIPVVVENHHANLVNYGFFSKAHEFFLTEAKPELGAFSNLAEKGFHAGSISTFVKYYQRARELGMEVPEELQKSAALASSILAKANVSDEQVVHQLDALGAVLRNRRIFAKEEPEIQSTDIDGVFSGVNFVFRVQGTPEEVFEMNIALALCEEELGVQKNLAFDAMFLPS